ncbi:hypothetical protein niasHT_018088 [Heterodera trifolii]|uniref:Chromo domain-containing protein n=1 Tax=Heterodera trifolii TaxID=157864 RepID=A0ABD2KXS0_9BILA
MVDCRLVWRQHCAASCNASTICQFGIWRPAALAFLGRIYVDAPAGSFGKRVTKNSKEDKYEIKDILAMTSYICQGKLRRIFYVHWLGYSHKDCSWLKPEMMDCQELMNDFTIDCIIPLARAPTGQVHTHDPYRLRQGIDGG